MSKRTARLLLLTLVTGCGYPLAAGPKPPNLDQAKFNQLWYYGAAQLQCPAKQVTYEQIGEARNLFKGCGNQIEMILMRDQLSMSGYYAREAAANRFSKEVGCDLVASHEQTINNTTHVVDGCGHRITYVFNCSMECNWVANLVSDDHKQ